MERNMAKLEEENEQLKQQLAKLTQDLHSHHIGTPMCPVEFTVTDFERKNECNETWVSPPFYLHKKGYKMCLKVFANGWLAGEDTSVSVYIVVQKGEFDDRLKWPIREKLKIQLLNKDPNCRHHTEIINFSEVGDAAKRVTRGEASNYMCGQSQYISQAQLRENYLKNDSIKFRLYV